MISVVDIPDMRALLIGFWGPTGCSGVKRAIAKTGGALRGKTGGYTLIESFSGDCRLSHKALLFAGLLAKACYDGGRIWRVVQIQLNGGEDPCMRLLHRTRWNRIVPEDEEPSLDRALKTAQEEMLENYEWVNLGRGLRSEITHFHPAMGSGRQNLSNKYTPSWR